MDVQSLELMRQLLESQIDSLSGELNFLRQLVYWGLGICATGFFVTVRWIMTSTVNGNQLDKLIKDVSEIRDALLGDYQKKGLITKLHEQEKKVSELIKDKGV